MSSLKNQIRAGVLGSHTREDARGISAARSTPLAWAFALVAIAACCGLPFLVLAAGGLASISVAARRYWLLSSGAAALVASAAAVGVARRASSRGRAQQMDGENEEDCCK